MKDALVAKIEAPTTLEKEGGGFKCGIGTGYPIAEGLLITARHVLYHPKINAKGERRISWQLSDEDKPYHDTTITEDDIVFESTAYDIALVKCDTAKLSIPSLSVISDVFPNTDDTWESMGYPRAGVNDDQREKTSAGGDFLRLIGTVIGST